MYNKLCFALLLTATSFFASCGSNGSNDAKKQDAVAAKIETDQIAFPDSTELYFYKNPEDLKKYKQSFQADSSFRTNLTQEINGKPLTQTFDCVFDSKIYLFKNGEPYKTVYAAYKKADCQYLCYVKDGHKIFFPINENIIKVLQHAEANPQREVDN